MSPEGSSQETPPEPGEDGTPVPAGFTVLRLGTPPSPKNVNDPGHALLTQGKAWPGLFAFSTKERELREAGGTPCLSVWLTALTTTAQAWVLTGGNDNSRILITLSVDRIRTIFATATTNPASPATPSLDVVWERAMRPVPTDPSQLVPEDRPGHKGHCGIDHLYCGTKPQQNRLRQLLADSVVPGELVILNDEQLSSFRQLAAQHGPLPGSTRSTT